MKDRRFALALILFISLVASCGQKTCTRDDMISVVHRDIKKADRDPDEYQLAAIEPEGDTIYVGMALKMSPLYRRHYIINLETCKIVSLKVDQ